MTLLETSHLVRLYATTRSLLGRAPEGVVAVDGVTLVVEAGESIGILGESGSGKSTLARCLVGLEHPDSGHVAFDGMELSRRHPHNLARMRRRMQMVFQDPDRALNPRRTVGAALAEAVRFHQRSSTRTVDDSVARLLQQVGLLPEDAQKLPSQLSAGQRQRVGIARALAVEPEVLIADEPVSALDVSVQAQILNLLMDLRDELGLTLLFISHDIEVVERMADRVLVMLGGRIVEDLPAASLRQGAAHPYTRALLAASPARDVGAPAMPEPLDGEPPSPFEPKVGCFFASRCPIARAACREREPNETHLAEDHMVDCLAVEEQKGPDR